MKYLLLLLLCAPAAAAPLTPSADAWLAWDGSGSGSGSLDLVWRVSPARIDPHDPDPYPKDYPHVPVELVATLNGVSLHAELSPTFGKLTCWELAKGEVAKLAFTEGGAGGYLVQRSGSAGDLEVVKWSQTDGACPDKHGNPAACPPKLTRVVGLHAPAGVKITQRIDTVDAHGKASRFACPR